MAFSSKVILEERGNQSLRCIYSVHAVSSVLGELRASDYNYNDILSYCLFAGTAFCNTSVIPLWETDLAEFLLALVNCLTLTALLSPQKYC